MFLKLLLPSLILILVAVAALAIRMLLIKGGRFPQTHVGQNKEMRKRGISCAQNIDVGCHPTDGYPGCSSCSVHNH